MSPHAAISERPVETGEAACATSAALVSVRNVVKRYPRRGGAPVRAVDGVSFDVRRGEIVGLLGANGAGKSTVIKIACGLVRPDAGSVHVAGHDVVRRRRHALAQLAAVLEGNRNLYWRLTVRENLRYFAGNRGLGPRRVAGEIEALLGRFGLTDKADQVVNALSRGMQQKLAIAVALLACSEVLFLDEPTLGLDVEAGHDVRALLAEIAAEGRTVVISTHDMPVVEQLCERVVIIDRGRVVIDERVEALLALFRTRAYRVRLVAPASTRLERTLRAAFPVVHVAGGGHTISVDVAEGDGVYRLVETLKAADAPLAALERSEVHFEEVFRHVVRERDAERVAASRGARRAPTSVEA